MHGVKRHRLRGVAAVVAVVVAIASFSPRVAGGVGPPHDRRRRHVPVGRLAARDDPAVQEPSPARSRTPCLKRWTWREASGGPDREGAAVVVPGGSDHQLRCRGSCRIRCRRSSRAISSSSSGRREPTDPTAGDRGPPRRKHGRPAPGRHVVFRLFADDQSGVAGRLGTISQLVGHQLTLPEITPDMIPAEAIQKLDTALGVTLPTTFGTLVVLNSDQLPKLQFAVNTAGKASSGGGAVRPLAGRGDLGLAASSADHLADRHRDRRGHRDRAPARHLLGRQRRQYRPARGARRAVRAIAEASSVVPRLPRIFLLPALLTVAIAPADGSLPLGAGVPSRHRGPGANTVHADGSVEAGSAATWVAAHRIAVMTAIGVVAIGILSLFDLTIGWSFLVVLVAVVFGLVAWRVLGRRRRSPRPCLGPARPRRHGRQHHPEARAADEIVGPGAPPTCMRPTR